MILPYIDSKKPGPKPYDHRMILSLCIFRILLRKTYADYEIEMRKDMRICDMLSLKIFPGKSTPQRSLSTIKMALLLFHSKITQLQSPKVIQLGNLQKIFGTLCRWFSRAFTISVLVLNLFLLFLKKDGATICILKNLIFVVEKWRWDFWPTMLGWLFFWNIRLRKISNLFLDAVWLARAMANFWDLLKIR